jgi:hypothetical protein
LRNLLYIDTFKKTSKAFSFKRFKVALNFLRNGYKWKVKIRSGLNEEQRRILKCTPLVRKEGLFHDVISGSPENVGSVPKF